MNSEAVEERVRTMREELLKIRQAYQLITEEIARMGSEVKENKQKEADEMTQKIMKDYKSISEALNHLEFEAINLDHVYAKEQDEINKLFL